MSSFGLSRGSWMLLCVLVALAFLPGKAAAFGAGNIPSIAQVEGHNWRHGDIEDMLETIAFLHGKKWTSMLIKRTYFGNWLRDYSQAVDVGSLKGVNAGTIRVLVWVLSFMAFGYATEEFEVTEERLGVYRPEEHIDNPLGYADGLDARTFDPRLRGPVEPIETEIDPRTGMKNYIANESGRWATSAGYLRYSFARSIHFGRLFTSGSQRKGKDEDLCEALRCLGQALHCLEDFTAHSNYCELALRELGHHTVFPHCGSQTEITIRGKRIYPLVTGTFGAVDFLHSVIGEATDHFTQSEVDEVDVALKTAESENSKKPSGLLGLIAPTDFISTLSKLPGVGGDLASQARSLKASSDAQEQQNNIRARADNGSNPSAIPGTDIDAVKVAGQIYPILKFRDNIVRTISRGISKIPGLEKLLDHIGETLTSFILGLLAPFVRPIITQVSKALKNGSSTVIASSAKSQLEPWNNPRCSDPTHSMLSKDHFTNILNSCAGRVASTMLQYAVPRILYAWENPNVPVDEVVNDILRSFHHPALRNDSIQIQRDMFHTVKKWVDEHPRRHEIDRMLSSESVKAGKNHSLKQSNNTNRSVDHGPGGHSHSPYDMMGEAGHGKVAGSLWAQIRSRDTQSMQGGDGDPANHYLSTSPAPPPNFSSGPPGQGYGNAPYPSGPPMPGGYGGPASQAADYYHGHPQNPHQPQHPPQGYGAPPPGQHWGGPPPQSYGGQGYGAPQQPLYGGYPGQHQPPSWNQYPGGGGGY
ncbi:heterokaryon incompatibility Het-C [Stachybotrys elegans]|uniref:Heterokaryon incompatibility Het-C n=1 Tax=Stachybotrys elegans TaxID=80388 RepID=A0A8K0SZU6_9HYPO|nr:heterokaryon incompatibility Het-C [Stachybotrys elegans]